jgi:transcriptional regulator with XRE-family HTH domain
MRAATKWVQPEHHQVVGAALEAARQRASITQVELARRLGKPQSVISAIEAGTRRVDLVEFLVIVRALGGRSGRNLRRDRRLIAQVAASFGADAECKIGYGDEQLVGRNIEHLTNETRQHAGQGVFLDVHVDPTDRWFLTYVLASDEFVAALNNGRLDIKIDGPHSLGNFGFRFSPPMTDLAKTSTIAFKSCL